MAQLVMDTLHVADALQRSGMERERAEGLARTLGTELGAHVAVNKDLGLGLERIRTHVDERFAQIDRQSAKLRGEIKGEIKALYSEFHVLGVGVALALAFLGVIAGFLGVIAVLDGLA